MPGVPPDVIHYFVTRDEGQAPRRSCCGPCWPACTCNRRASQPFALVGRYVLGYTLLLVVETVAVGLLGASVFGLGQLELFAFMVVLVGMCLFALLNLWRCWQASTVAAVASYACSLRIQLVWSLVMELCSCVALVRVMNSTTSFGLHDSLAIALWLQHSVAVLMLAVATWRVRPGTPAVIVACKFADVPEEIRSRADDLKCVVCLAEFAPSDLVFQLPCRHLYHSGCLGEWLQRSEVCPMRCGGTRLQLPPHLRGQQPHVRWTDPRAVTLAPSTVGRPVLRGESPLAEASMPEPPPLVPSPAATAERASDFSVQHF